MALTLINTQTASGASSVSFTSGIDSTYKTYIFKSIRIHPSDNGVEWTFQANVSGASGYNETILSTYFRGYYTESGSTDHFGYQAPFDQSGTAFQPINPGIGNQADAVGDGELWIFNPSSTTYVKHFHNRSSQMGSSPAARDSFTAGFFNVTGAITEVQFKMASGTFDGVISMYGMSE